jgi:hypothetical protein
VTWSKSLRLWFRSSWRSWSRCWTVQIARLSLASAAAMVMLMPSGCCSTSSGRDPMIVPTGEPMLVMEGSGRVRLAAMNAKGEWIDLGWKDASTLPGFTVVQYDWSEPKR